MMMEAIKYLDFLEPFEKYEQNLTIESNPEESENLELILKFHSVTRYYADESGTNA